jgi:hypothetical protein
VAFNTDTESYAGDDPSGAGDTGVGYGSTSMDTGGNETDGSVLSQAGFNSAMNITSKNPFGDAGFFTSVFGIDPKSIDYSNIFSADEREAIANQQYGLYSNPQNQPGFGYNPNVPTVTTGVREGLTRGFGSLFGSPVGTPTTRGTVQAQRAADPLGSVMRGAFALAAPPFSLPSLAAQNLGKDTYTTSLAPDYDPTKDPNSPSYTGPSSMGGIVNALSMLGTGMTSTTAQEVYGATKEAVEEAIDYFSNPKGGSIQIQDAFSTDRSPGMMSGRDPSLSGIASLSPAQVEEVRDAFETKTDKEDKENVGGFLGSPQGYSITSTTGNFDLPGFSSRSMSDEEAEAIISSITRR